MQDGGQKRTAGINQEDKSNESSKVHPVAASALKTLEKAQLLASIQQDLMAELSGSEEGEVSEVESFILDQEELEGAPILDTASKLLQFDNAGNPDLRAVDPETLEALFEAAGIDKLTTADGKALTDPEILGRLTSSVSSALDEAEAALFRMRAENAGSFVGQGAEGAAFYEAGVIDEAGNLKRVPDEKALHENTEEGESLLSLACSGGYYELAQVLLKMNANVEDRGHKGDCTPLMEAASAGHVGVVKLLLEYGADINATSAAGNTPLMYACSGGHEEVVKVLLDSGANIEDHNENGHTPLMEAASSGHVGIAKVLLERGAGINTHSNEFKESALTLACYKGHLEMVKFLLEAGADHEHKTDEMHTALMEASMDGHVEVARLLLDHGAQVNMPADSFESPLTLAACGGHVKLAALLIERGANIEEVNDEGYTPLMEAAREGHEEMVALLLAQGANIDAQTEETQETALTLACCGGFLEVAKFLIEVGADIELGCSTPLMEAAQEGHVELVKFLLSKDADVHATTATGDTALTYACENGHTDVADVLLAADADLEHESEGGRTPLMKAARAGHLCTVQYLISRGAEVNRGTSNNDHTVLSLACAGGHLPVVELLLAHGADPSHKLKDNSTCLIEASKGGHSGVMALVLGYPHNLVSSGPLEGTLTPPTPESGDIPRVPTQALHTVVPPQEPDKHPEDAQEARQQDSSVLAAAAATLTSPIGDNLSQRKPTSTSLEDLDAEVAASVLSTNFPTSILERAAKSLPDMKIGKPHGKRSKSAEEQILEKQQIIAELQKVERELQQRMDVTKVQSLTDLSQEALTAAATRGQLMQDPFNFSRLAGEVIIGQDQPARQAGKTGGSEANNNKTSSHGTTVTRIGDVADVDALDMREIKLNHVNQRKPGDKEENSTSATSSQDDLSSLSHDVGTAIEHGDINDLDGAPPEKVAQIPMRTDSLPNGITSSDAELLRQTASEMADAGNQVSFSAEDVANLQRIAEMAAATPLPDMQTLLGTMEPPSEPPFEGIPGMEMRLGDEDRGDGTDVDAGLMVAAPACSLHDTGEQDEEQTAADHNKKAAPQTQSVGTQCDSPSIPCRVSSPLTLVTSQQSPTTHLTDPVSPGDGFDAEPFMPHPPVEIDAQTESNHDTALTIACAGGHDELVQMLLDKQANMEHRDKKGFTPLILAATAGHYKTVEILLNHGADIEAQSERTKDTPLSLACSGGRYDVVDLLLSRGANKEHRNVSDYTPLSLAASGGYVNIIKLLLRYEAEINSRTGSKLGISPLMLAAMNGHTAAVKLLLDMGSDINAQIETNRNTALTLACFQGRTEVVSLLVDRRANVEHRAKTGLTPLMEAASGGYADVGRVLIEKGADVNAPPVPSSRDTALTIAADKGHYRFVELLLSHGAAVDVKNKKGNSPLWLACNGGHLDVVQLLVHAGADIDSQDNRKVSCLMAAFRKGHVKVVRWMVKHVNQFPSDSECMRFIATISDKELLKKCHQCMEIIVAAKDRQAAEANKNASILLEELESEKSREESRKAAAAKRREKKKKKKKEKQLKEVIVEPDQDEEGDGGDESPSPTPEIDEPVPIEPPTATTTTTIGKALTTNTQPVTTMANGSAKKSKMMRMSTASSMNKSRVAITTPSSPMAINNTTTSTKDTSSSSSSSSSTSSIASMEKLKGGGKVISDAHPSVTVRKKQAEMEAAKLERKEERKERMKEKERKKKIKDKLGDHSTSDHHHHHHGGSHKSDGGSVKNNPMTAASPKRGQKRDDGWKEVVRRSKKVSVPASAISRVIGRGGCNINAIRESTGAHIDVDRQNKGGERTINIKGSADSTRQAHQLIMELIKDPDKDIADIVGKLKKSHSHSSSTNQHASTNNNASSSNHPPTKSTNSTTSKGSAIIVTSNAVKNASSSKGNQGLLKAIAPQSAPLGATYAPTLAQAVFPSTIPQFKAAGIPLTQFTPSFQQQQQAATVPTTGWGSFQVRAVHPATATAAAQKRQNAAAAAAALALARASKHGTTTTTSAGTCTVTTSVVSTVSTSQAQNTKSPRSAGAVRQLFPQQQQQQQQAKQQPALVNSVSTALTAASKPQVVNASSNNGGNPPTFASKIVDNKSSGSNQKQQSPQVQIPHVSAATPQSTHSPVQSMNSAVPLSQQAVPTSAASVNNQTGFSLFNQPSSSHSMGFWGTAVQQRHQQPMPRMEANGEVNRSGPEMAKAPGYKRSSIGSSVQASMQPSVNAAFLNTGYGAPGSNFTSTQPYNININTGLPDQQDYQSAMSALNTNPQYNPIPTPVSHAQPPTPPTTVMSTSSSPISPGTSPRSGTTTPSPVALTSEPPQAIGQDRRLPRPIGNERITRQQRKTPVGFPSIGSDMVNPMGSVANSIWAYNPVDSAGDWMEEMTGSPADFMTATASTGYPQYQDMQVPPPQQQQHPMSHPGSTGNHQQQQINHATAVQQQQPHMDMDGYRLPPHMNMAYGSRDGLNQEPMHGSLPPSTLGLTNDAQMAMGDGVWNNAVMNSAQEGDPNQMWGVWSQSAM